MQKPVKLRRVFDVEVFQSLKTIHDLLSEYVWSPNLDTRPSSPEQAEYITAVMESERYRKQLQKISNINFNVNPESRAFANNCVTMYAEDNVENNVWFSDDTSLDEIVQSLRAYVDNESDHDFPYYSIISKQLKSLEQFLQSERNILNARIADHIFQIINGDGTSIKVSFEGMTIGSTKIGVTKPLLLLQCLYEAKGKYVQSDVLARQLDLVDNPTLSKLVYELKKKLESYGVASETASELIQNASSRGYRLNFQLIQE